MRVFVKNIRGESLMPCSQRKARILLKSKKAIICNYNPFTIQLTYATGETKQPINIGIDTGSKHIGIAITSEDKVLYKAEVELRQDVKKHIQTRKTYRKDRRNRKTRYRKPRFLNRKRIDKWLPPSIQSKINITFHWIDTFCNLVPHPKLHIEVGKFDTAKLINPEIQGIDYQRGQTYGYYNVRYFVFARDNYTCQVCGKQNKILRTHHIIYKGEGGTDRADNLITVCNDCHTYENHQPGHILHEWFIQRKETKKYTEPPFMNSLRLRIFNKYPNAIITYGSETTPKRKELQLEKTHHDDAIAISGINTIKENSNEWLLIRQFRKKKRSLHEATIRKGRKEPNHTQKRNNKNVCYNKGFYLNDKVEVFGQVGYITGFTGTYVYVKDVNNNYITIPNKSYKQVNIKELKLINHNNNWQFIIQ